jgi:hypothetical protein
MYCFDFFEVYIFKDPHVLPAKAYVSSEYLKAC